MRIITYDCEIELDPRQHKEGWAGARQGKCGLASFVLYDTWTQRYHIYGPSVDRQGKRTPGTVHAGALHLAEADLLVGFNSYEFDNPLMEATTGIRLSNPHYDLLQEIWNALGERKKGFGLGPLSERTLNLEKSGEGARAPELFQTGRFAELHDYNLNDVFLTRMLVNQVIAHGYVTRPDGSALLVNKPPTKGEEV